MMQARPDGSRVLLAESQEVLGFVDRHYAFEERRVVPLKVEVSREGCRVGAGSLVMELELEPPGAMSWLLAARPRRLRTFRPWIALEDVVFRPLVAPLLGGGATIRARGRTRAGAREWYAIHAFRSAKARAWLDGVDLGEAVPAGPSGFGFSEFPPMPAAVRVTSLIAP